MLEENLNNHLFQRLFRHIHQSYSIDVAENNHEQKQEAHTQIDHGTDLLE